MREELVNTIKAFMASKQCVLCTVCIVLNLLNQLKFQALLQEFDNLFKLKREITR